MFSSELFNQAEVVEQLIINFIHLTIGANITNLAYSLYFYHLNWFSITHLY